MIRFKNYFNSWLYEKNGYYTNYKKIGKQGDFYTSVSTSKFFGGAIAKKIISLYDEGFLEKDSLIVEIGAEKGYLMADIIEFLYTLKPNLLNEFRFIIIEKFEEIQNLQKKYLQESFGNFIEFEFYKDINELEKYYKNSSFIYSNEIFDSFSCDLIYTKNEILNLAFIENNKIKFIPNEDKNILKYSQKYGIKKGEVPNYKEFIDSICNIFSKFFFLTFDYGQDFARDDFSIRVYKNHKVYSIFEDDFDFKEFFQNSDITYDVNFLYLIDCFKDNNIENITYQTQARTLIDFGIIELLEILKANCDEKSFQKELQKAKLLFDTKTFGERFKTLQVKKG